MVAAPDFVLTAFRKVWLWDMTVARPGRVADYQALFPGFERAVAEEFERLSSELPSSEEAQVKERRRIGPYRLDGLLGRGGQGAVYAATDSRGGRRVALKVLAADAGMSPARLERLRREAEAVARMRHPGICGIHEAALDGEVPYLALQLVEGRTLAETIARARRARPSSLGTVDAAGLLELPEPMTSAPPREAAVRVAEFFEKAALAVHVAHEAGLLHRDVKPGNLMVTPSGEPVMLDFGLARDEGAGCTFTLTGALLGTPAYMAPEQVAPDGRLDRRVDVYALGVSLFESLTLLHPFEAPTQAGSVRAGLAREARDLRELDARFPDDLALIVATALRRSPDCRYRTALALAEDLRAFRDGRPIRARPPSLSQRLRDWSRRRPAVAAATAVAFVTLTAGLAVSLTLLGETKGALDGQTAAHAAASRSRGGALDVIQFLLGDFQTQLSSVGRTDLLESMTAKTTAYFDSISVDELTDDDRHTVAESLASLGMAHEKQGHREEQIRLRDRALAIRRDLYERNPDEPKYARALADSLSASARRELSGGRIEDAIGLFERTDELMGALPSQLRSELQLLGDHVLVVRMLGSARNRLGRTGAGNEALRRAVALGEELMRAHPDDVEALQQGTMAELELVWALDAQGRLTETSALLDAASVRARAFVARHPDQPFARAVLGDVLMDVAEHAHDRGDFELAERNAVEVRDIYATLQERDPRSVRWRNLNVQAHQRLTRVLVARGKFHEAVEVGRQSRGLADVAMNAPAVAVDPRAKCHVSTVLRTFGCALWRDGAFDEAETQFRESQKFVEEAMAIAPQDVGVQFGFVMHWAEVGAVFAETAESCALAGDDRASRDALTPPTGSKDVAERALETLGRAESLAARAFAAHPDALRFARRRAFVLRDLATARCATGDLHGAEAALESAVRVRDDLAKRDVLLAARLGDLEARLADVRRSLTASK